MVENSAKGVPKSRWRQGGFVDSVVNNASVHPFRVKGLVVSASKLFFRVAPFVYCLLDHHPQRCYFSPWNLQRCFFREKQLPASLYFVFFH